MQSGLWTRLGGLLGISALLVACGGPPGTPTPLSPDVARPEQPTPVYAGNTTFNEVVTTPIFATPILTPSTIISDTSAPVNLGFDRSLLAQVPPSGLGLVLGGTALLDRPGGTVLEQLPGGTPLTLTGKSADGLWLAVYTNGGVAGWVNAADLARYGEESLLVVEQAFGPGPVATLIADAMIPIEMPPIDLTPPITR
jgi:hypothetical protein